MSMTNYIIVMKALEDGKFLITFPDFEGLTATADSEENIQSVALERLGRTLSDDELLTAKKGLEWGLLTDIDAVYSAIFDEIK